MSEPSVEFAAAVVVVSVTEAGADAVLLKGELVEKLVERLAAVRTGSAPHG